MRCFADADRTLARRQANSHLAFGVKGIRRAPLQQQGFGPLNEPCKRHSFEGPRYQRFAGLSGMAPPPGCVSNLSFIATFSFRHLRQQHDLTSGLLEAVNAKLAAQRPLGEDTVVDATGMAAPSSTMFSAGTRDPNTR